MTAKAARQKLAILVNTIAPYRIPVYEVMADSFTATVLHGGREANREWEVNLPKCLNAVRVFTIQLPIARETGVRGVRDISYLHLNLGLLWWLPWLSPDIVVSNEMGFRTCIALIYGKLARVPVWVWWGGTSHSEHNISSVKKRFRQLLSKIVPNWISYGKTSTEYLLSLGVGREKILQIQNCVPRNDFTHSSSSTGWFKDAPRPVLLSVGQLRDRKGLDRLIEACGRMQAAGHAFTLAIVGSGPKRKDLLDLARKLDLHSFFMLPNQSPATLNEIYHAADAFVFPTMEDVWGLVVNEAISAGLPVICSQFAGCAAELVNPEDLFDPLSDQSFDAALLRIFERKVVPADINRLRSCNEVGESIRRSLVAGRPIEFPPVV